MARGLDVGTMNILSTSQDRGETVFVQQRNSFVEIDHNDMTEQILSRSDVLHIRKDDEVYVVGDDAPNFANIFGEETRRPMQHSILSSGESSAVPMIELIIEQVIGSPSRPNERLFYSSSADPINSDLSTLYHDKTLESMLDDMGYDPEPINEGMAVIYSELVDNNFTGLGVSFGVRMTNVCPVYYAVPVMQFSIVHGDGWIGQRVARATGTAVDKITSIKEGDLQLDFRTDVGDVEDALSIYYENLLSYVIENIEREVDEEDVEEGFDIPIVVTGGTSSPEGFEELSEHHLRDSTIPFSVNGARSTDRLLYSVIRGSLVATRSEEESDKGASDPEPEARAASESN